MSETSKSRGEGVLFLLALLVVAILVTAFLTMGVAGIGLVMVVATPVMLVLLVLASGGN
jgi:hypothetical protein